MNIDQRFSGRSDIILLKNEPMGNHTGFEAGGSADFVAIPKTTDALLEMVQALQAADTPFCFLGNGSNILVRDSGYPGWILKTGEALREIRVADDGKILCGAGVSLTSLCEAAAVAGLTGLEFAYGIPGTLGGAVFMNAGAYDGEMRDVVAQVEVYDNDERTTLSNEEMGFGYRTSVVQQSRALILGATLQLQTGDRAQIQTRMAELLQRRKDKQPLEYPSCGSTFKRPEGNYASKLIDECGLRGTAVGGAQVSEKHCGFIVNRGGATATEILTLVEEVQKTVQEQTGVLLACEIQILP